VSAARAIFEDFIGFGCIVAGFGRTPRRLP
jgi:hypothetical protein